jgi:hypothetical protein
VADKVRITKRGIEALQWDSDAQRHVERKVRSALYVLRWECNLETGVTLGDIFRFVEQDPELFRFLQVWCACDVAAFHADARKPATGKDSDLACIEIAKYFEWNDRAARETIHVSGIGEPNARGETRYALDFTPLNKVAHLPVRLRPEIEIRKGREKLGDAPCTFTLIDVLGEIYWEISFWGSPEDRDRQAAKLDEAVREVEEGRAKGIPLERLLKRQPSWYGRRSRRQGKPSVPPATNTPLD